MTTARRARGAGAMAVGSALSGVLAYVFFALVTRAVGADAAAGVSVLWTYWSFAAAALTFPFQHWIVRTISAAGGQEGGVRRVLPWLALVTGVLAALVLLGSWLLRDPLFHHDGVAYPVLVAAVTVGSALVAVVRGVLTVRGRLVTVAVTLASENGLRCLLAIGLMAGGSADARMFGLALALGQVVALCWPSALRLDPAGPRQPWVRFVAAAASGQVLGQTILTGGPVALALLGGRPGEVTGLFAALALFRLPYTLAMGAVPPLTGVFTRMGAAGRHQALRRVFALVLGCSVLLAVLGALVADLIGPWLLKLVFGSTVEVDSTVCATVAAGSVLALGTVLLSLLAMADDRSGSLLRSWIAGAVAATVVLLVGPGTPILTVAWAFVIAEAVAFVLLGLDQAVHRARSGQPRFGENSRTS